MLNGERPGDRERSAQNLALFDHMIRRGETLTDFVLRWDAQIAEAEVHGLKLPDPVKARYLEEGAALTAQNNINLWTIALGQTDFASIRSALLKLDVTEKRALPTPPPAPHKAFPAE
eukprot:8733657-Pyramimonas_sp.AAC.1